VELPLCFLDKIVWEGEVKLLAFWSQIRKQRRVLCILVVKVSKTLGIVKGNLGLLPVLFVML